MHFGSDKDAHRLPLKGRVVEGFGDTESARPIPDDPSEGSPPRVGWIFHFLVENASSSCEGAINFHVDGF